MIVAYNMSEWRAFLKLFRSPRGDVLVLMSTFLLTVLIDLTVAIQVGVILASFLFLKRMSEETRVSVITENLGDHEEEETRDISRLEVPPEVEVFEIYGSLFFGAMDRFRDAIRRIEKRPKALILRMRHVPSVDATGLQSMEELLHDCRRHHVALVLSAVSPRTLETMRRAGFVERLGEENLAPDIFKALERVQSLLAGDPSEGGIAGPREFSTGSSH
ncbi:MAG TPA: STAS domain-containing protein [Candidatus Polarisedimenticolia bacterium]|nr:STAS domain-containing protein [Candidatus Polarisedimenticolia bacterium]